MIDGSLPIDSEDIAHLNEKAFDKIIVVANKLDNGTLESNKSFMTTLSHISCSLLTDDSVPEIQQLIGDKLSKLHSCNHQSTISERHRRLVVLSLKDITEANLLISSNQPEPTLAASRLRSALETLGEVTGKLYHDELLQSVFSRFCIGK